MTIPNPQNPNDPMYQFIDTQPTDEPPQSPDSSLSHFTIRQYVPENITAALPMVVTITAHGFQNGQALRATQFITIPFASATGMEQLNNQMFYVQQATTNTFQLYNANGIPIDGRNFTSYIQGGQFTLVGTWPSIETVNPSEFPPSGIPPFPPV